MGLAILVVGLAGFFAPHVLTALRGPRQRLIDRIGAGPYKAGYSLVSAAGIVLIAYGFSVYRATGWIDLWYPPLWMRHLTALLVWPAMICIVAAYSPGRIKVALKHPFLVGVKLWAFAHLLSNGDLGSILLFGSFLAWGVYARIAAKRRGELTGSNPTVGLGSAAANDAVAVVAGTALYFAIGYWFHPAVIGVPAFGR